MSNTIHFAELRDGKITALCGVHRKRREWEGRLGSAKEVDCRGCIRRLIKHSRSLEARERREGHHEDCSGR